MYLDLGYNQSYRFVFFILNTSYITHIVFSSSGMKLNLTMYNLHCTFIAPNY